MYLHIKNNKERKKQHNLQTINNIEQDWMEAGGKKNAFVDSSLEINSTQEKKKKRKKNNKTQLTSLAFPPFLSAYTLFIVDHLTQLFYLLNMFFVLHLKNLSGIV